MIVCLLLLAGGVDVWAQPMSASAFRDLAQRCASDAPLATLRSIAEVESGFNPLALNLNYSEAAARNLGIAEGAVVLARQPSTLREALNWSRWFVTHGMTVSVGLMQVNVRDLPNVEVSFEQLFEPCLNLRIGWTIFQRKYVAAAALLGRGQRAMHAALSAYNGGDLSARLEPGVVFDHSAEPDTEADIVPPPAVMPVAPSSVEEPKGSARLTTETSPPNPRTIDSRLSWDLRRANALWVRVNSRSITAPAEKSTGLRQ